jgi:NAD-specific glutamate dehydrogenase
MNELLIEAKKILNESTFHRLDKRTIRNDLYVAQKELNRLYEKVKRGDDYESEAMKKIILWLQNVDKKAKRFKSGDTIPAQYE